MSRTVVNYCDNCGKELNPDNQNVIAVFFAKSCIENVHKKDFKSLKIYVASNMNARIYYHEICNDCLGEIPEKSYASNSFWLTSQGKKLLNKLFGWFK